MVRVIPEPAMRTLRSTAALNTSPPLHSAAPTPCHRVSCCSTRRQPENTYGMNHQSTSSIAGCLKGTAFCSRVKARRHSSACPRRPTVADAAQRSCWSVTNEQIRRAAEQWMTLAAVNETYHAGLRSLCERQLRWGSKRSGGLHDRDDALAGRGRRPGYPVTRTVTARPSRCGILP